MKTADTDVKTAQKPGVMKRIVWRRYLTPAALVVMFIFFSILKPSAFFNYDNISNILQTVSVLGVFAVGQTMVMCLGHFDISMGTTASLAGVLVATLMVNQNVPVAVAVLIGILGGMVCGAVNGALSAYAKLPSFIATLGMMTVYSGIAFTITNGTTIGFLPEGFKSMGIGYVGRVPILVIIMLGVFLVAWVLMQKTTLGRRWYALGGNIEASFLAGLRTRRLTFAGFVVCGALAAFAGILLGARIGNGAPGMGDGYLMPVITAVFLGTTAFRDGVPNIGGTLIGVLIVGVLGNGLDINGVNTFIQLIVTGAITIAAVSLSVSTKKGRT